MKGFLEDKESNEWEVVSRGRNTNINANTLLEKTGSSSRTQEKAKDLA